MDALQAVVRKVWWVVAILVGFGLSVWMSIDRDIGVVYYLSGLLVYLGMSGGHFRYRRARRCVK
ncbi:MAG TPA: hypothetical protein VG435_20415 [Acidimicrobiales bacterium]|nr:hypothetical protein [Acidimicrobiales bacterium]